MTRMLFVHKFEKVKQTLLPCLPEESLIVWLDGQCVLITLPPKTNRKALLQSCREQLGETQAGLLQPVIDYREGSGTVKITLPEITRFFPKKGHGAPLSDILSERHT